MGNINPIDFYAESIKKIEKVIHIPKEL